MLVAAQPVIAQGRNDTAVPDAIAVTVPQHPLELRAQTPQHREAAVDRLELAPGDPPTVAGLAEAIVRALADPEHYRNLCAGARRKASEFSLDRHVSQLDLILSPKTSAVHMTHSIA